MNHTAQPSISPREGGIIILSVGLGGGGRNGKDPNHLLPENKEDIENALRPLKTGNLEVTVFTLEEQLLIT